MADPAQTGYSAGVNLKYLSQVKETYDSDLGCIRFTKRKQSKRITVRYDPKGVIKVSLPLRVSYQSAIQYVLSNKKQIKEKVVDLQLEQYSHDLSHFKTYWHEVEIRREEREKISHQILQKKILIRIPDHLDQKDHAVQKAIRLALEETLRMEARIYLPQRLKELANQHRINYNNLYIKNVQSLWGSCSSKNNINLNIHLMRLPDHLIDYVLSHELCHTLHKDHSRRFWGHLQRMMDQDVFKLRKELNQYTPKLF